MFLTLASATSPLHVLLGSVVAFALAAAPTPVAAEDDVSEGGAFSFDESELEAVGDSSVLNQQQMIMGGVAALGAGILEYVSIKDLEGFPYLLSAGCFAGLVGVVGYEYGITRKEMSALYCAFVGLPAVALATAGTSYASHNIFPKEQPQNDIPDIPTPVPAPSGTTLRLVQDLPTAPPTTSNIANKVKYIEDFKLAVDKLISLHEQPTLSAEEQKAFDFKLDDMLTFVKAIMTAAVNEAATHTVPTDVKPYVTLCDRIIDVLGNWKYKTSLKYAEAGSPDVEIPQITTALAAATAALVPLKAKHAELGARLFTLGSAERFKNEKNIDVLFDGLKDAHNFALNHPDAATKSKCSTILNQIVDLIRNHKHGLNHYAELKQVPQDADAARAQVKKLLAHLESANVKVILNKDAGITGATENDFIFMKEKESLEKTLKLLEPVALDTFIKNHLELKFNPENPDLSLLVHYIIDLTARMDEDKDKVTAEIKTKIEPVLVYFKACAAKTDPKDVTKGGCIDKLRDALNKVNNLFTKLPTNEMIGPDNAEGDSKDPILNRGMIRQLNIAFGGTLSTDEVNAMLKEKDNLMNEKNPYKLYTFIRQIVKIYKKAGHTQHNDVREALIAIIPLFIAACKKPEVPFFVMNGDAYHVGLFQAIRKVQEFFADDVELEKEYAELLKLDSLYMTCVKRAMKAHGTDHREQIKNFILEVQKMGNPPEDQEEQLKDVLVKCADTFLKRCNDDKSWPLGNYDLDKDNLNLDILKEFIKLNIGSIKLSELFHQSERVLLQRIAENKY